MEAQMAAEMLKPDEALLERIEAVTASMPVRRKKMFGTSSWFLDSNDQMFAGVWGDGILVRVGQEETQSLIASGAASAFDPMGGRPMKEYVLLEGDAIAEDSELSEWLERAAQFTAMLAPKVKKAKKKA
jgi:TfoX/Sxy family transcriptional regulator of competence genes